MNAMSFRILFIVGLFLAPMMSRAAESSAAIAVKIDIPEICRDGKVIVPRTLENRYADDHFSVILENVSPKTIFLRGEDGDALSFEVTDENGQKTVIHHVTEIESGRPPASMRLEPGDATARVIYYAARRYGQSAQWEAFPFPHEATRTDTSYKITLRAVYEQDALANAAKVNYWTGRVVSRPYEVLLENNELRISGDYGQSSPTDGVDMRLSVLATNRETEFEVAFKNQGTNDVCLNLGEMLANGKLQIPDKVQLKLKDTSGVTWQWVFPLAGVAGRVDDFVVPLRAGSSYSVLVPLRQFVSADYRQHDPELDPGRYEVSAEFQGTGAGMANSDMEGITTMNFWKGKLQEGIVTEIR